MEKDADASEPARSCFKMALFTMHADLHPPHRQFKDEAALTA